MSTFVWSPETEVERVAYTATVLTNGFYQRKGFVILPDFKTPGDIREVILPELDYLSIRGFWEKTAKIDRNFPLQMKDDYRKAMMAMVKPRLEINVTLMAKREKEWRKREERFWEYISATFPKAAMLASKVEIRLTRWGTGGSFKVLEVTKEQELIVYWRVDRSVATLAEVILSGLLMPYKQKYWFSWGEFEAMVDLLLGESALAKLFSNHEATVEGLKQIDLEKRHESERYLQRLGLPKVTSDLELNGRRIWVKGKGVEGMLSEREEAVMRLLVERRSELVSFDEVADVWWESGEFTSLWALNKAMQRLRIKGVKLGLGQGWLKTVRKRGYVVEG
jgi:hypothetical protein